MRERFLQPRIAGFAVLAVLIIVFPFLHTWPVTSLIVSNEFRTFQATRFMEWLVILMGLNLLTGYSGQISLGHGALVAVGAYIAAILMHEYEAPVSLAVLAAGLGTGVLGFFLGIPALRLRGPYLAIATMALIIALPQILKMDRVSDWTGGVQGLLLHSPRTPAAVSSLSTRTWLYYSVTLPSLIMTVLAWNIIHSRFGQAFIALRDSEIGAQQMGVNVPLYKITAFGLSAFYAGIGGGLFVYTEAYLSPDTFDLLGSFTMLVMIVLGGLGSVLGTIIAAIIMTGRLEIVDWVAKVPLGFDVRIDQLRAAIYGGLLIISVIFAPTGVAGQIRGLREQLPALLSRLRVARPQEAPAPSLATTPANPSEPVRTGDESRKTEHL